MPVRVPAFHQFAITTLNRPRRRVPRHIQHPISMRQIFDFARALRHPQSVSERRRRTANVVADRYRNVMVEGNSSTLESAVEPD